MLDTKNSPSRNYYSKRPRKVNTFSTPSVHHTEVGEFQDGYFVMPDENSNSLKKKAHSPARRKHSEPPFPSMKSTSSPSSYKKNNNYPSPSPYSSPSPVVVSEKEIIQSGSQHELMSPSYLSKSASKPVNTNKQNMQSFIMDTPDKRSYKYDIASSAPAATPSPLSSKDPSTPSRCFAGPAFGNAPPPSSLPIPQFPPMQAPTSPGGCFHAHGRSLSVDSSLSSLMSYPPPENRAPSPPTHPSLDQLSIDLRRMLNIGDPTIVSA